MITKTPQKSGDGFRTRRAILGLLMSLAALLAVGCSGPESSTRPNIIFVLTDDLDSASVRKMPEIGSSLIDEGTSFENDFVSHPLCCPSRSTILTGLYDHNHNVRSNNPPDGGFGKFVAEGHEENTIAVRLQEGGYRTALFGKYLNGYPDKDDLTHVPPGWDEWYGKLDGQKLYDYRLNENGEVVSYGNDTGDFYTDVLSGQATDFVRRAASDSSEPFFMYVAPTAPHAPATPAERHQGAFAGEAPPRPPSFDEEDVLDKPSLIRNAARFSDEEISQIDGRYEKRLESMLAVDEMVGSLVKELKDAGELENTYIFFTSDNGFEQGEHRIPNAKNRSYEESSRVPLIVRGPGVTVGSETGKLAVNTDFAPTFADLAGVEFGGADGRSLAPLLRGGDPSWRSSVLLEKLPQKGSDEEEGDKAKGKAKGKVEAKGKTKTKDKKAKAGVPTSPAYEAVRTETHKYVEYENGEKELYDLEADPYELDNVYESADPTLVEDLKAELDALRNCAGDGCREAEDTR